MVDHFLHTAMFYPGNYGFVPHTLAEDGDPIDVLIVGTVAVAPGAVVRCRPVGALIMEDENGPDERSSPCRSTSSTHITSKCAPTVTCRRSCAARSPISFVITKIWSQANGSRSATG